jgi:hypothetical protein
MHEGRATDLVEIRALAERYFYALDTRQLDLLSGCFAPGATMTLEGVTKRFDDLDLVPEAFRGITAFRSTRHLLTSQHVDFEDQRAAAHALAVAIVVGSDGAAHIRGISYRDRLVQTADGWRISHREHDAEWQIDAPIVPPALAQASWGDRPH